MIHLRSTTQLSHIHPDTLKPPPPIETLEVVDPDVAEEENSPSGSQDATFAGTLLILSGTARIWSKARLRLRLGAAAEDQTVQHRRIRRTEFETESTDHLRI